MLKKKNIIKNKKQSVYNVNIDNYHQSKINTFDNEENNVLPKLEKQLATVERGIARTKNPEKLQELQERKTNITSKIKKIKKQRTEYYLNNCNYIFDYFEEKQNLQDNKNVKKNLNSFFNISENSSQQYDEHRNKNLQIHTRYFKNNDFNHINISNFVYSKDICKSCNEGELIQVPQDGILICNKCFKSYKYLVENDKPSYKEPPKEICFYAYKRINHFREILAQFQAKESTDIPDEIINRIKLQIKKERLSLEELTNRKTKDILKKLGYNKYYEHIPFIKDKLGIKPPIMSSQLEETLCSLFMDIQEPYSKYCPKERVNFLNYYYTIYKLCELLGQNEFLPFFPMLIDREKKIEQDLIWKKICKELNWDFIPTV